MCKTPLGTVINSGDICPEDGLWAIYDEFGNYILEEPIWKGNIALPNSGKTRRLELIKYLFRDNRYAGKEPK